MAESKTSSSSEVETNESALFGDGVRLDISMRDLFGGDLSILRQETAGARPAPKKVASAGGFQFTHFVLLLNVVIIAGLLVYFLKIRPMPAAGAGPQAGQTAAVPMETTAAPVTPTANAGTESPEAVTAAGPKHQGQLTVSLHTAKALGEAISLQSAKQLAQQQDYYTAAYVYEQLRLNITGSDVKEQCLRDWLSLQMALCLQKTDQQALMGECFTQALGSKSMVVRSMANYALAVIQINNRQFMEARSRAFGAMSLLKIFEKSMPATLEADCYFLAAEGLTRSLLQMKNQTPDLQGAGWSDSIPMHELPVLNQEQLCTLLVTGVDHMEQAVIMPKVEYHSDRHVGSQWSVTCMDAPLEQLLWQYGSETNLNFVWDDEKSEIRRKRSTVYLPFSDRRQIAEVITGSLGLVWRYDGDGGTVYDPSHYRSFADMEQVLAQEAIASWQRFLLYYRTDERAANAHYCLGKLFGLIDETATALGEYKILSTQYYGSDLAPLALLEAGKIKTGLLDYKGAKEDLNELLIRYPNCKVADTALLYLAEATMKSGQYGEASELFDRARRTHIGDQDRSTALYGLGRCAYELKNYADTVKWLGQALQTPADAGDMRVGPACFLLGRSYIELGQYAQATGALRQALGNALDNREYVEIVTDLVEAECSQNNYMQAMSLLESIPEQRLNQEDTCRVLTMKAKIYRDIDLPDTAISVLRRRIEFIAEAPLRAMLSVELAQCYYVNGDYTIAKKELNGSLYDLPVGRARQQCSYLLAQTCLKLGELEQAENHCVTALRSGIEDGQLRADVFGLLGQIYDKQQMYDKAAMAYAGLLKEEMIP